MMVQRPRGARHDDRPGSHQRRAGADQGRLPAGAGDRPASSAQGLHHFALICSDVRADHRLLPGRAGVPAHRDLREPRLRRLQPLLLRHRPRQPAGVLRPARSRPRPVRRGARRPAPPRDLGHARRSGTTCGASSTRPASSTSSSARSRSTSATPTAPGSSCSPTRWARCTAPRCSEGVMSEPLDHLLEKYAPPRRAGRRQRPAGAGGASSTRLPEQADAARALAGGGLPRRREPGEHRLRRPPPAAGRRRSTRPRSMLGTTPGARAWRSAAPWHDSQAGRRSASPATRSRP